ncbi:MAG: TetR/AcrR family transcriptional regulator, partial [SAR324 cluster bacterium]|nr:TetR/AcrR family transcriptional regulator [SAR324 cluster bacterium]
MRKRSAAKKEEILQIAVKMFATNGFDGTSINHIADALSVTKPMIYYYFSNKAGLYQGVLDLALDQSFALISKASQKAGPWEDRLAGVVKANFDFSINNPDLSRIFFATLFSAPKSIPQEITYQEKSARSREIISALIQEGLENGYFKNLDPKMLTDTLNALIVYQVINILVNPQTSASLETAEQIIAVFLKGVGAE